MTRTVTATEAKNRLGALMNEVIESNEPVIIELRGRPKIAMITKERLQEIEEIERLQRHQRAITALDELNVEIAARGSTLSEAEAMELAVEAVQEIRADRYESRKRDATNTDPHD
jgi:prevent-host-death family protein